MGLVRLFMHLKNNVGKINKQNFLQYKQSTIYKSNMKWVNQKGNKKIEPISFEHIN